MASNTHWHNIISKLKGISIMMVIMLCFVSAPKTEKVAGPWHSFKSDPLINQSSCFNFFRTFFYGPNVALSCNTRPFFGITKSPFYGIFFFLLTEFFIISVSFLVIFFVVYSLAYFAIASCFIQTPYVFVELADGFFFFTIGTLFLYHGVSNIPHPNKECKHFQATQ